MTIQQTIQALYLEYLNNFLTVERFAEYHNLSMVDAQTLVNMGREFHREATE